MLLAADVGGTKTLLGLFDGRALRPSEVTLRSYSTGAFDSFADMLARFIADVGPFDVEAAAAGVAGPVVDQRALITNVGWAIDASEIARALKIGGARVLNDLEAMATSIGVLSSTEVEVLQAGVPDPHGNAAIIAAGTGLGVAALHRVGDRFVPMPSESGHTDFAARTDTEIELLRHLRVKFGRATVEHVLSGQGFIHLHEVAHAAHRCQAVLDLTSPDAPAQITASALEANCPACAEALRMFVEAYGAEAGNVALRTLATAGIYLGGGIAPKILPALRTGRFINAFRDKAPMVDIVSRVPVSVILNQHAGLLGAAVAARQLLAIA